MLRSLKKKKWLLILVALVLLLLIALFLAKALRPKVNLPELASPDLSPKGYDKWAVSTPRRAKAVQDYFLVETKLGWSKYALLIEDWPVVSWPNVKTEEELRSITSLSALVDAWPESVEKPRILATSQLDYLSLLARRGDKSAFFKGLKGFQKLFIQAAEGLPDASIYESLEFAKELKGKEVADWQLRLKYIRTLFDAYKTWPSQKLKREITKQAQILEPDLESFKATCTIDNPVISYPVVGLHTKTSKQDQAKAATLAAVDLSGVDLYSLSCLTEWDLLDRATLSKWKDVLTQADRGSGFYAGYYIPELKAYSLSSEPFIVDSSSSLKILLSLAELEPDLHRSEIMDWELRFIDNQTLVTNYHLVTGMAMSDSADLEAMAILGRIIAGTGRSKELYLELGQRLDFYSQGIKNNSSSSLAWLGLDGRNFDASIGLQILLAGY